ncbi:hypothetical protein SRB5_16550 [Streptomyces sp. RB5]|uniref:WXG100 family type VII secretion target n=1 Tax=Streptomyces smaragdinus TaxID=2585196 RepID=A0A7K0CDT0_9ACTN|nr:hypothetical protein [Streptomyces smaragdinus]MQY11536.1 hypothetical protein [Streptomyces smaragdinus]
MTLTYQDVVTADLAPLSDAAGAWQKMGERFGELKGNYDTHVSRALDNGRWQGEAFNAHQTNSKATTFEFGAAQTEAQAVSTVLRDAHTELTRLQKAVKDIVTDAEANEFKVDSNGKATYTGFDKLSPQEQQSARHDPDYPQIQALAKRREQEWTDAIAKAVKSVDEYDQSVQRVLAAATTDNAIDGGGFGGFNGDANADVAKATAETKTQPAGKDEGWVGEGKSEANGPNAGAEAKGPDWSKGEVGSAEAHANLADASAEGTLQNGPVELSGKAEAAVGAKAEAAAKLGLDGLDAEASASVGASASAEGSARAYHVGVSGSAEAFAGAEAGVNVVAGKEGLGFNAEAFAGAKGEVSAGADVAGIGIGATAEGWAGPGAEAGAGVTKDAQGKWHIGAKVGISPGLGGALGFEVTVDPKEFTDTVGDIAGGVKNAWNSIF